MRKLLVGLVVAFALFYLFTQPQGAAEAVRGAAGAVVVAFNSVIEFITALFHK
jgi:Na+/H+ antiporter NhaD/arsenite permease-like protein